jgi:hypothetical protein
MQEAPILFIYQFISKHCASLIAKPELHMAARFQIKIPSLLIK